MTKLLVYRFSAMGDVVLLLPVLKGVLDANSDVEIYLLTQPAFFPVFQDIDRLFLIEADIKGQHSGLVGLFKIYKRIINDVRPDFVFDVHGVIRTYILDFLFWISGYKVANFRKGTFRKWKIIRSKALKYLPNTIERYSDVFIDAGYQVSLPEPPIFQSDYLPEGFNRIFDKSLLIGIAPFAKHPQKIWGIAKVEDLISEINRFHNASIVLFGGGGSELDVLNQIAGKYPNCIVSANHYRLADEIRLIPKLAVMISMDSANMHLASIAGVPTISIWGATHPALGFAPYKQPVENIMQYSGDKLPCRPCSVYGNKKCIYNDGVRCMEFISVNTIIVRINQILKEKKQ